MEAGDKFGFLTLLGECEEKSKQGAKLFELACECGAIIRRTKGALKVIKSCGCKQQINIKHRARVANTKQPQGEDHGGADHFSLISPDGVFCEGRNLNHFIRQNPQLFLAVDVTWKGGACRASVGLHSLNGPIAKSWKGWTKASR